MERGPRSVALRKPLTSLNVARLEPSLCNAKKHKSTGDQRKQKKEKKKKHRKKKKKKKTSSTSISGSELGDQLLGREDWSNRMVSITCRLISCLLWSVCDVFFATREDHSVRHWWTPSNQPQKSVNMSCTTSNSGRALDY